LGYLGGRNREFPDTNPQAVMKRTSDRACAACSHQHYPNNLAVVPHQMVYAVESPSLFLWSLSENKSNQSLTFAVMRNARSARIFLSVHKIAGITSAVIVTTSTDARRLIPYPRAVETL